MPSHLPNPDDMRQVEIVTSTFAAQHEAIKSVRHEVFIVEQGIDPKLEWDSNDHNAVFALAFDNARCVGTARLLSSGKIGRMAVLPKWRHQGVGSMLLETLIEHAKYMGLERVTLASQVPVCQFYIKHGFIPLGESHSEAGIQHQNMYRNL